MEDVVELLASLADKGVKLSLEQDQLHCYAPPGAVNDEDRRAITQLRPQIIALLRGEAAPPDNASRGRSMPLSAGSIGLYLFYQLNPASSAYNVPLCFRSRRGIDARRLAQAWQLLQSEYPILQSRVAEQDGRLCHVVDDACRSVLVQEDVGIEDNAEMLELLRERAKRPFDLEHGPLTRLELFTQPDGTATLMMTIHHIVVDGISLVILARRLFPLYLALSTGQEPVAAKPSSGMSDFVAWEDELLASTEGKALAGYWQRQLHGAPFSLNLPPLAGAGDLAGFGTRTRIERLSPEASQRISAFSNQHGVPPSTVFLAAYQLLLHRYTGQDDIVVLMPVMGRAGRRFLNDVGYFVNLVPLRSGYLKQTDFIAWVQDAQRTMMDALFHSPYPFPLMISDMKLNGAHVGNTFRTAYAYQNVLQLQNSALPDGRVSDVEMVGEISQEGAADLGLEVFENNGVFSLHLKYSEGLLSAPIASRLLTHLANLLAAAVLEPARPIHSYPLLSADERHQLLEGFNATLAHYDQSRCIHELFEEQAARDPARTAAVFGEASLSYGELHARCGALASHLQSLGIGADSLVGLYMERSLELTVGLMGTLMAGGAYVPLDPDYPAERLSYMLEDTRARVVLTLGRLKERLRALAGPDTVLIALDDDWAQVEASAQGAHRNQLARPDSLAYVIYTSGSTGEPRGVMLEHRALMNRIQWMQKRYQLDERDVVLQKTPYSFDVSVWEFVWPLMSGARVVFAEPGGHMDVNYLQRLIDGAGVTTLHFVPSMLRAFLEHAPGACPGVRQVFCSGEALDWRSAAHYRERFPNAALHNLYGPTEAAIDVAAYDCASLPGQSVPIGAPIDNIQIHILDAQSDLQPIGVPGELAIAGHGLARGYLNRPDLTAERFVDNPFRPGEKLYRTGDLARRLEDGNIQYLGRIDTQVKVRGMRIELAEIEARLNAHPQVEDSAVIAHGNGDDVRLVAFYVARPPRADLDARALCAHLQVKLPAHMVPATFVRLERIPLTFSGKVDRHALERTEIGMQEHDYVAPRTTSERRLAGLWEELLGLAAGTVGVRNSFVDLGGHSLLATQLLARVRAEFGVELPLREFFYAPMVEGMAAFVDAAIARKAAAAAPALSRADAAPLSDTQARQTLVPIQPHGTGPALFAVAGAGGNVFSFAPLCRALVHILRDERAGPVPFYGLQAAGLDGGQPSASVEEAAQLNLAALRSAQPAGPYRLIGHSFGGAVAYEMARQLRLHGETVASLVLLDSLAPDVVRETPPDDVAIALALELRSLIARNYPDKHIELDLARLQRLEPAQRGEYISAALERQGLPSDPGQIGTVLRVFDANVAAYRRYRPEPLPGDVDVSLLRVSAQQGLSAAAPTDYGWGALLGRAPRVEHVAGGHLSMLANENALQLATILCACMPGLLTVGEQG